jgi:hypothetical protein
MKIRWFVLASALVGLIAADPALARARKAMPVCVDQPYEFSLYNFLFGPGRAPAPNGCAPPVYVNGRYIGQDPDPNIRFQLRRDPASGGALDLIE